MLFGICLRFHTIKFAFGFQKQVKLQIKQNLEDISENKKLMNYLKSVMQKV